jgi:hypothetical protein
MKKLIPADKKIDLDLSSDVVDKHLPLTIHTKQHSFSIHKLAQWSARFASKTSDLTSKLYIADNDHFNPDQPISMARKLIGEDEQITLGSIRNKLYFGPDVSIGGLEREHFRILLSQQLLTITNLSHFSLKITNSSHE